MGCTIWTTVTLQPSKCGMLGNRLIPRQRNQQWVVSKGCLSLSPHSHLLPYLPGNVSAARTLSQLHLSWAELYLRALTQMSHFPLYRPWKLHIIEPLASCWIWLMVTKSSKSETQRQVTQFPMRFFFRELGRKPNEEHKVQLK